METPSDGQPEQAPPSSGDAFDQAAIDAPLNGAAGDGAAEGAAASSSKAGEQEGDSTPEVSQGVSQADVDALLSAAGNAGDAGGAEALQQASESTSSKSDPDTRTDALGRPFDEAAAAMQAAIEEEKASTSGTAQASPEPGEPPPDTEPFDLPQFSAPTNLGIDPKRVTMLNDVNLRVKIELGRTRMLVEDVLKLDEGSVVELDKLAGDPVDVYVNDRLVARGEVLVLNDSFCVRISEVLSRDPHRITA